MKSSPGPIVPSPRIVRLFAVSACLLAGFTARAANDYWAGSPGVTATTNWSDANNWTSAQQTYYNQVEFLGPGANANNNFAVNNVLDNIAAPGPAQMPIWELDFTPTNGNYTTLIDPGITMQIGAGNGNLKVGADILHTGSPAPANAVETVTIAGPGAALTMAGNLYVGQGSVTPNDTHNVTLDLSGLDNFAMTANNNYIYLASGAAARANGVLYLAKTNNIVLGNGIQMGNQSTSSNSQPIALYLGINNSITLGGSGNFNIGQTGISTNGALVEFNPAFLGGATPPTATFNSSASGGRINNVYVCNTSQSFAGYGLCNLSGGSVNVLASTLEVAASSSGSGAATGVLTFDMGTINASSAYVGRQQSSGGGLASGTVNINSNSTYAASASLIVGGTLSIAGTAGTVTPGTAGTINLNGGALSAGVITNGGGTGSINATNGVITISGNAGTLAAPISNLNLNNSTLNLAVVSLTMDPVVVGTLATGGGNQINVASMPPSSSYPVQITLVKYSGAIGGAGYNFTLGTLPSLCSGYLSNNVANASVDLVLTAGPAFLTWVGSANANWDTTSANWSAGSINLYSDGDFVKFLDGADAGTVNLTASFAPGGVTVSNNVLPYVFNGSGSIGGNGSLVKQGTGTLIVDNSGNNTYSGGTIISNGVLQVGDNDTGGNLPGAIADYGVLAYDRTDTSGLGIGNTISGTGGFVQAGAGGTLQLSGANTFSGAVLVTNGSTLQLGSSLALGGGTNKITVVASGSTLDINGYTAGGTVMVAGTGVSGNGALTDSGYSVYDNPGPGFATNITLTGDTTFYYPTRWDMGSSAGGNVISTLGQPYNLTLNSSSGYFEWRNLALDPALANITVQSGNLGVVGTTSFGNPADTLVLTPSGQLTIYGASVYVNKAVDFQNGASINNASGANTMNGTMTLETGAYCQFNVSGGTTLTLSNSLTGAGVLYQNGGTGTAILDGNSPAFTGGVILYSGQTTLNGLIGSGITAYAGTTLTGSGTADGLVDVGGNFYPGGQSGAGTFTAAGGLTLESTAALTMDLGATTGVGGGTNDLIAITGDLTVNGNNISINPLAGSLATGSYVLMTYSGNLNGSFGTAATVTSSRYSFTLDTSTPHEIKLDVAGVPNLLAWNNGSGDGQWNTQSSYDWTNLTSHVEDQFYSSDVVLLDNTILGAANPNTTLTIGSGLVTPSVITNNSSTNYTITGSGQIGGAASLVKLGSSTLTINTVNTFTGNTVIEAGTVLINGQLQPAGSGIGGTNGVLSITNGGELIVDEQGGYPGGDCGFGLKPLILSGNGADGNGAIQNNGNAIYSDGSPSPGFAKNVTLTGNTTIGGSSRWDWGDQATPQYLNSGGSNYNFTAIESGYAQWFEVMIDTNLGNIDYYTTAGSQQTWAVHGFGSSLGNPTNILTLHSNVTMDIGHSDFGNYDNGYAKVIHVVPTAIFEYAPGGGNGDYRLATSFILDNGAEFDFFNGNGGSGSGTAISGTLVLNGLVHFQVGDSTVTLSNVISGTGGFYWDNYNNTLAFAATNTYQGITDIRSGRTLALIGNGSIGGSAEISLASGAVLDASGRGDQTLTLAGGQTLVGGGQVNGTLAAGAGSTVAPGTTNTTGALTMTNNVTLAGNALFKLNGTTNDLLTAGGTLAYGGTLTLTNISGMPLAAGNSFKLFNAAGYSGAFAAISPATPGAGLTWNTNALSSSGVISVVSSAPPTISSITISGGNIIISGSTGGASGSYDLLTSTNIAAPLANWTVAASGTFGGSTFSVTNAVGAGSQQFYLIRVP